MKIGDVSIRCQHAPGGLNVICNECKDLAEEIYAKGLRDGVEKTAEAGNALADAADAVRLEWRDQGSDGLAATSYRPIRVTSIQRLYEKVKAYRALIPANEGEGT